MSGYITGLDSRMVLDSRGRPTVEVDCFVDGSVLAAGFTPFLEAAVGASGANARVLTSADTIDALILDGGSTGESAARFRIHVVLADISVNPVETATVSTGT